MQEYKKAQARLSSSFEAQFLEGGGFVPTVQACHTITAPLQPPLGGSQLPTSAVGAGSTRTPYRDLPIGTSQQPTMEQNVAELLRRFVRFETTLRDVQQTIADVQQTLKDVQTDVKGLDGRLKRIEDSHPEDPNDSDAGW